jgi:hypothetical protein
MPAKNAPLSMTSRIRDLVFWLSILTIPWAVGQKSAASDGVSLFRALHESREELAVSRSDETVRAELARLQKETGLSLASDQDGIEIVSFDKRTLIHGRKFFGLSSWGVISRDGTQIAARYFHEHNFMLGIIRSDGTNLREYPAVVPQDICWSNDKSKLAVTVHNGSPNTPLNIMDLQANVTTEIDPTGQLTTQCWSPDDKNILYEADGSVRIHEIGKDRSSVRILAQGKFPTWSPDGNWIAFLDRNTYYAIHPNGQGRKKLFHEGNTSSPVYWSPDSRIVAYVRFARFAIDDVSELRVRRLEDNSKDWVAEGQIPGGNFQWVTSPELLKQIETATASK